LLVGEKDHHVGWVLGRGTHSGTLLVRKVVSKKVGEDRFLFNGEVCGEEYKMEFRSTKKGPPHREGPFI